MYIFYDDFHLSLVNFILWIPGKGGYFGSHRAPAPPHENKVTTRLKRETIATSWHPHRTSLQACRPNTSPKTTNNERTTPNDSLHLLTRSGTSPTPPSFQHHQRRRKEEEKRGDTKGEKKGRFPAVESELANETSTYKSPANQTTTTQTAIMGKVHGSLARAGKVKSQTPKVRWLDSPPE